MLTVELKPFRDAVTKAASVVKPNSPKPILQYLLLTADRNVLSIRASDLEVSVVVKCSCDATEPMKFVLPAAMLRDYLKLATGEQVTIKMEGAIAKLRTDRGGMRNMPTIDAGDFPAPDSVSGHAWELPCRALKAAMRVRYAAEDSTRYAMNSVNFQTIEGQRYAVACNGRMLAVQELGETTGEDRRALLPESSSRILANLLPDEGTASVEDDGNRIAVSCEGLDFTSGQMEGRYPEWKKIVPTDLPIRVEIAAAEVFGADLLTCRGLHQRRAGEEDRALLADDDRLVAHRRDIGAARGAGAHDGGDLRDAGGGHVRLIVEDAAEMVAVGEDFVLVGEVRAAAVDKINARQVVLRGDVLRAQVFFDGERVVRPALHGGVVADDHAVHAADATDASNQAGTRRVVAVHVQRRQWGDF